MAKKPSAVSAAVRACRDALGLTQAGFGAWSGFSTQTIVRWENGMRSPPRTAQRHLLVHNVASKRADLAGPLAAALGVALPVASSASTTPAAPPPPAPVAIDERELRATVYRAAEELEIPAGRFREALAELVLQWSAQKWETGAIAKALSASARSRPSPTRRGR